MFVEMRGRETSARSGGGPEGMRSGATNNPSLSAIAYGMLVMNLTLEGLWSSSV